MRRPSARSATIVPILPQPIRPSVLPVSSTPMKRDFSHLPAWVDMSAAGIWRAVANSMAMACSAVVMVLPWGVFITTTPRAVAAGMSTLSTPMPARPITLRFSAAASRSAVTLVADRMARPSYWPMIAFCSSGERPGLKSTSTPRSRKISIARSDSLSEIRTLGMDQAACFREALASAKAQSSHGVSAATSSGSTVAPPHIRRLGGASRWLFTS